MNKLISAIKSRDAGALATIAGGAYREPVVNENAVKLVDALFDNLIRLFPAARHTVLTTPEDVVSMKRQWILAFAENGITTVEQIRAGVRMARQNDQDFWPSCGKFIGWCQSGSAIAVGLPTEDEVMAEFERYAAHRGEYANAQVFPWGHPVLYWIVMDLREAMYQGSLTTGEIRKRIPGHLITWAKKLSRGETVPAPVQGITYQQRPQTVVQEKNLDPDGRYHQMGMAFLERIRARNARQGKNL